MTPSYGDASDSKPLGFELSSRVPAVQAATRDLGGPARGPLKASPNVNDTPQPSTPVTTLSVLILTQNEESNLPACLASIQPLSAPVYIVDSGSTDRTLAIAESAGATVARHLFENYGKQRNWAQANLPLQGDWVLHLDADERLTPELAAEIRTLMANPPATIDGYLLCKRTIFMGRWIRHGGQYPSYHLRLFRRAKGRCEDRLYDQHYLVDGKTARLKHDYIDIITSDLTTWTQRHLRWADLEVQEYLRAQGSSLPPLPLQGRGQGREVSRVQPRLLGTPIERKRWLRKQFGRSPRFLRAFLLGLYRYFLRLGFLDGKEGLIFHFLQGVWYRFMIDAKLHEVQLRLSKGSGG